MPFYTVFFGNDQSSVALFTTKIKKDVVSQTCHLEDKVLEAGWPSSVAFRDAFNSASYDWEQPFTVKATPEATKYFIISVTVVENTKKRGRPAIVATPQDPPQRRSKFDSVSMPPPVPEVLGAHVAISRMLRKASMLAISTAEQCATEYNRLCSGIAEEVELDKLPELTLRAKMCSTQYDGALRDISSVIVSGEDRTPLFNKDKLRSFSLDDKLCDQYARTAAAEVLLGIDHHEPADILQLLKYMYINDDDITNRRINDLLIHFPKETKRRLFTFAFYEFLHLKADEDEIELHDHVLDRLYTAYDPVDEIHAAYIRCCYGRSGCTYTEMIEARYSHEQLADFALHSMDQTAEDEAIFKWLIQFLTPEDNVRDDSYQKMLQAQYERFPNDELKEVLAKYINTLPNRTENVN